MSKIIERDGVYGMTSKDLRQLGRQLKEEIRTKSSGGNHANHSNGSKQNQSQQVEDPKNGNSA